MCCVNWKFSCKVTEIRCVRTRVGFQQKLQTASKSQHDYNLTWWKIRNSN